MNSELQGRLESYKHLDVEVFRKPSKEYSQEQKDFSMTIYLYSPKAYEYLRPFLHLPAPRTIGRWLEKFNAELGIQGAMLQGLKELHDKDPVNYTHCGMIIDAMALKNMLRTTRELRPRLAGSTSASGSHLISSPRRR